MRVALVACLGAVGCAGETNGGTDAPTAAVPATIKASGFVASRSAAGSERLANVTVGGYRQGVDGAAEVTATSAADGTYSLELPTGGVAIEGYLKATLAPYLETYVYPPYALASDYPDIEIVMLTGETLELVANTLCGANLTPEQAVVGMLISDGGQPVAGATIGSAPAATRYCYNEGGVPNRNATSTDVDGAAYYLGLPPGKVTVSAVKAGLRLPSHSVMARAGVFTITPIQATQ